MNEADTIRRRKVKQPREVFPKTAKQGTVSKDRNRGGGGGRCAELAGGKWSMTRVLGFTFCDFSSWSSFVKFMNKPKDPASLGITRFAFGLLMCMDTLQERGMTHADFRWGDPEECRFPLINWLRPLPLPWMYVLYMLMFTGSLGIMLGMAFRVSCLLYAVPYWYMFWLDKTSWNNHSYLYGLISLMMLVSDGHHYWSVDGWLRPTIRNTHVPLWNYAILRAQIFLVYFIAGLKKLDRDWIDGYSMQKLSKHRVFSPFLYLLSEDQVDLWVVHYGGLMIDLFIGYVLYFDATRWAGLLFGGMFHAMNSQIFSIGMFPYTMLATLPLFCYTDWPRRAVKFMPTSLMTFLPSLDPPVHSSHCIYPEANTSKPLKEKSNKHTGKQRSLSKTSLLHNVAVVGVVLFLSVQCMLPYSHFISKGYNNWTNGLYGYSWDMMVHSWSTQHIRIMYRNKDTGHTGYLNPAAFSRSNRRWNSHADMVKQYAQCIKHQLLEYDMHNVELYFDIWKSLNQRFQQRMVDPRVDILTADWHPFKATSWIMPLLTNLSDWRTRLDEIQKGIYTDNNDTDAVFIADFPGLSLENFIQPELGNTSLQVLKGQVTVELLSEGEENGHSRNISLMEGQSTKIPAGQYHNVHVSPAGPACYMYMYVNTTQVELLKNMSAYEEYLQNKANGTVETNATMESIAALYQSVQDQKLQLDTKANRTFIEALSAFVTHKYKHFMRGLLLSKVAVESLVTGASFSAVFNATIGDEPLTEEYRVHYD